MYEYISYLSVKFKKRHYNNNYFIAEIKFDFNISMRFYYEIITSS